MFHDERAPGPSAGRKPGPFGPMVLGMRIGISTDVAAGLSLLLVTLRSYGRQMPRRLSQDEEFAARYKRWQDDRRPHQGTPAGK